MLLSILFATLVAGLCGIGVFIYYLKKGQFEDFEKVKYQMFHDEK